MESNTKSGVVALDDFIAWPNGGGETPCSRMYLETLEAKEAAERLASVAEDDEDWDQWRLQAARAAQLGEALWSLREQGHLGAPRSYDAPSAAMALLGGATVTADGRVWHGEHFVGRL
jgi:hypothetical protein